MVRPQRAARIADIRDIAAHFELDGTFISAERYGGGHINDTFVVNTAAGGTTVRYVLQRINQQVFRDPVALMENVRRVLSHLQSKLTAGQRCLSLVATDSGDDVFVDDDRDYWRVYRFIEGACTVDAVANRGQAREAAAMFGRFQCLLRDLPGPRLHETIPDFHNTPVRYRQFRVALEEDRCDRARQCAAEIACALAFEERAGVLAALRTAGDLPERITHNDTKLNNVMFERSSGAAVCVIDVDTVMPGLALDDFGDLVRSATAAAAEDAADVSAVTMRPDYFAALADGYLEETAAFLTETEIAHLAVSGEVITIETGLRFLTDYLAGDAYFRVDRPAQNLERCRAQFALAASIGRQLDEMQETVMRLASRPGRNAS